MTDIPLRAGANALREFDENFHFLAYPFRIMVWTCDQAGLCEFVSPSWLSFTGRELKCELAKGWLERVHADDLPDLQNHLEQALRAQQPFRLLYRYLRADGEYRWFIHQGMLRTSADGEFSGYIGQCFDVTALQEFDPCDAEMELSAQRLFALLKQTRLIAVVLDQTGKILFSNGSLCRLLKHSGTALINTPLFPDYLAPSNRDLLDTIYPQADDKVCLPAEFESTLLVGNGELRDVFWHSITLSEYCGHAESTILIGDDITQSRRAEEQLKLTSSVFEYTSQAMLITDKEFNIISVNQSFTDLTGYSREEVLGKNPRILKSGRHDLSFYQQMWKSINDTGHWRGDMWDRHKNGSIYPKMLSISVIKDKQGVITNYCGIFYEISERKKIEEELDFLAHYDSLTGLPNRSLLFDRLKQSVGRATREGSKVGLLYLDLDHFKQVNDTWGHHAGDSLLQAVAQRMNECLRSADTVARLGGDEFVVLVPDILEIEEVARVAKKLLQALTPAYHLDGKSIVTTPSIGISIYPDDHHDIEMLLEHADAAMYEVKQSRRGNFKFFHELDKKI